MPDDRKAAIDLDAMEDKALSTITAADFLTALGQSGGVAVHAMRVWPEKKKLELFVEPENLGKVTVGGILRGVREKKKVELEKDPRPEIAKDLRSEVLHKAPGPEFELIDPKDLVINPAVRAVITEVAKEVVKQIGAGAAPGGVR